MLARLSTLVVGISLLALLVGCGEDRKPLDPNIYHNKARGFAITLPADWERKENVMGMVVAGLRPAASGNPFRENVNVVVEDIPANTSLEEYAKGNLANMKKLLTDFKEVSTATVMIGAADAKHIVYTHRMGELKLSVALWLLVKGKRGYVITGTALPESFEKYRGKFEAIAETFRMD